MFERRIAEAGDETVGIGQQINAGNGQRRSLFVKHQLAGGAAEDVIPHAVANVRMPCQIAKPGARKEWLPLSIRSFICSRGQHVIGHLHARRLPGGSPGDKVIFDHPLNEGFATDGAGIVDPSTAAISASDSGVAAGTMRSTMVPGKLTLSAIQSASAGLRFPPCRGWHFYHVTVVGDIIAGEHGKGRKASFPAAGQRFN